MENQNLQPELPTIPSLDPAGISNSGKSNRSIKIIYIFLTLVLALLSLVSGYWYGKGGQKVTASNVTTSMQSDNSTTTQPQGVHFVGSVGYPLLGGNGTNKYKFITNLGVPSAMQAVRITSTIQNQSTGLQMFTDGTFNNELGRWELGNSGDPEDNSGGNSEISLIAIENGWLTQTGTMDYSMYNSGDGNPLETPAQKQQFMAQTISLTTACAKDPSKGFVTKDGNLKVCYTFNYGHGAYGVYDPIVLLTGYGDVNNQPLILIGFISIYDPTLVSASPVDRQNANQDASNGKVPVTTAEAQQALITALKQTTVTAIPK